jgi:hypothetical protein
MPKRRLERQMRSAMRSLMLCLQQELVPFRSCVAALAVDREGRSSHARPSIGKPLRLGLAPRGYTRRAQERRCGKRNGPPTQAGLTSSSSTEFRNMSRPLQRLCKLLRIRFGRRLLSYEGFIPKALRWQVYEPAGRDPCQKKTAPVRGRESGEECRELPGTVSTRRAKNRSWRRPRDYRMFRAGPLVVGPAGGTGVAEFVVGR